MQPKSARGIEGLRTSLIGRAAELAILHDAMVGLMRGEGKALAIIGEAGLGKSRLIAEARSLLPCRRAVARSRTILYT